jgi:hypothetical protein
MAVNANEHPVMRSRLLMGINSRSFEKDLELILARSNSFAKLKARERQARP